MTSLRPLAIAPGRAAVAALPPLRRALDGEFAALPYAAGGPPPRVPPGAVPDDGTALVVGTSGSTGEPKLAMLPATALAASAAATHDRLGGPGSWLLAMPPHHIAGVQVLLRCLAAETEPAFVDLTAGFTTTAFTSAATAMAGAARRYTSLVPTQLVRLLADPEAVQALSRFDAVLVGGAATPPALRRRAAQLAVPIVSTYGMSETCGGCVYDGLPLQASAIRADSENRLHLGGATLATGYLGRAELSRAAFSRDADGLAWFRTDDTGHQDPSGRWHVDGRLDDLVTTGGLKVAPRLVEEALTGLPDIEEAVVVGTPDDEWGQAVSAAITLARGASHRPTVGVLRTRLRGILPDHALPRRALVLDALPLRGPGKPDRAAVRDLFATGRDTMEP